MVKIAIAVSSFNPEITEGLLSSAKDYLTQMKVEYQVYQVPGAFELPLLAYALTSHFDGVIALGCVIKGETRHFEIISDTCAQGLMKVGLKTGKPISFGVLTTYTEEQARARLDKGKEAAEGCLLSILTLQKLHSY